jgi:phosphoribosylformylglycinamidine synthase
VKAAVIVFPGSNCDRDCKTAIERSTGAAVEMIWHGETALPAGLDLIVLPGGFAYGDYLRCGAMAAQSPIMHDVKAKADKGLAVLGICNGFQVLTEAGMLPGVLMRNAELKFVCRPVSLEVEETQSAFTRKYEKGQRVSFPVAHGDGNYTADEATLDQLEGEGRVVFRYAPGDNPNGSARNIAGILSRKRNVLGLMPHPERVCDAALGGTDGRSLFESLVEALS